MRIFQEEIFGPVLSVTTFKDEKEAKKPLCFKIQRLIFARLNSESTLT